jgi:hypothetical protein
MPADILDRVKTRVRDGMCPEAAIGLEWRLMRAREGFDGNTWAADEARNAPTAATIAIRIAVLKLLSHGETSSAAIAQKVPGKNLPLIVKRMNDAGYIKVVRKVSSRCNVYEITRKGWDWLADNDRQGGLFDD